MLKDYIVISKEVQEAIDNNKPVVALESTIISHGMPYPQNLETAIACERIVRENGAIPATTAVLDGKLRIGLTQEELEFMAKPENVSKITKMSRRDVPVLVANKGNGSTTVATTILLANLAGIKILVTGGIGGVHRGAETTFDISRDLQELATTDIAVVCAGAKSILDIGLTLEYLETFGVPVIGYKTDEMPAFYTRKSGYKVDYNLQTPEEIAKMLYTKWDLGMKGGVLVTNPIPEENSMDEKLIAKCIEDALKEAKEKGIKGKETTPFLLDKVLQITEGKSLEANMALVKNNAVVGAKIAVNMYKK